MLEDNNKNSQVQLEPLPESVEELEKIRRSFAQRVEDLKMGSTKFGEIIFNPEYHAEGELESYDPKKGSFAGYLSQKYPEDYRKTLLFHVLAGSTIQKGLPIIKRDFPGEDSVEKFVEDLEAQKSRGEL